MSLVTAALALVVDAALGAWLGAMAFFSFVGAPRAFAVLGEDAGPYVTDVFPRYYRLGVGLGAVAFAAGLGQVAVARGGGVEAVDGAALVALAATAVGVVIAGYSVGVLVPRMDAAGDDAFERYHGRSVALNGLVMVSVSLALVAAHLP